MPELMMIFIRSLLSFFALLLLTRLMGKKQLSQLTFFDYVVGITIGSIAASMSVDQNIMLANGLVGLAVWGLIPILISVVELKSYFFRMMTDGSPTILIEDGQILEKNLVKEQIPLDKLMSLLRQNNAFKLADVEFAILETNGQLSVMKKSEAEAVTPRILDIPTEKMEDPRLVIFDGEVMESTLDEIGVTKEWLLGEIIKQGAKTYSDVFAAQLESNGNVYIDLYDDQKKVTQPNQKAMLKATLEKTRADLMIYTLDTDNPEAKQMFDQEAQRIEKTLQSLNSYLNG
ncbi:hypothetical protein BEP19_03810 [Ammoniphilus oxalaticus]|uniref:DUF421 domain-containing protein n=1 Tax=Ammoniphilus oxalaticus TaxID=66863 RepID=A0A419SLW2_9BACL|nr:DUF421 domain-containing protein [Ammoniphilus oxalaticus]RKD24972.1 hypothetical protein BEP19_03810 [Ammoniphilus oxalaticus]